VKNKVKPTIKKKPKIICIFGNECDFIWDHFEMSKRRANDRLFLKFIEYKGE